MPEIGDYYKDTDGKIKKVVEIPSWEESTFRAEYDANLKRLQWAEERLASIPVKTKPDAETLAYWLAANTQEREQAQAEVDRLQTIVDKMKVPLAIVAVEK